MRARTFWIALPIAVVFALWAGQGLAREDEMPPTPVPTPEPIDDARENVEPAAIDPLAPALEPECEAPVDPGPDGDL